jgi:hypothetical protein
MNVPTPQPFESRTGYFFRLANANHMDLKTLFLSTRKSAGFNSPIWSAEGQYAQPTAERFDLWWKGSRVCVACLRNDRKPYLRTHWEGALTVLCVKHQLALVGYCPHCMVPLSRHRRYLLKCDCGADWRSLNPWPLTRSLARAMAFHGIDMHCQDLHAASTDNRLVNASVDALVNIVVTSRRGLGQALLHEDYLGSRRTNSAFDVVEAWFERWPHNARLIWKNYQERTSTNAWQWDAAYPPHLIRRFTTQRVIFEPLESMAFEPRPGEAQRGRYLPAARMTDVEFCERTGLNQREAWMWMRRVTGAPFDASCEPVPEVSRCGARALISLLNMTEDIGRAAQFVGIDADVLLRLAHQKVVDSIRFEMTSSQTMPTGHNPHGVYRVVLRDLERFLAVVFQRCRVRTTALPAVCGFSDAMRIAQKERCEHGFMLAIQAEELTPHGAVPRPTLANELYFDASQLRIYFEANRQQQASRHGGSEASRSIREALELYELTEVAHLPRMASIRGGKVRPLRL